MVMDTRTLARYDARAQVFKALAHPSRLLIVDQLMLSERCVCDLTALVGSDMSTVSRHLSVLKAAGVVADERRGAQIWYRLRMKCVTSSSPAWTPSCSAKPVNSSAWSTPIPFASSSHRKGIEKT